MKTKYNFLIFVHMFVYFLIFLFVIHNSVERVARNVGHIQIQIYLTYSRFIRKYTFWRKDQRLCFSVVAISQRIKKFEVGIFRGTRTPFRPYSTALAVVIRSFTREINNSIRECGSADLTTTLLSRLLKLFKVNIFE